MPVNRLTYAVVVALVAGAGWADEPAAPVLSPRCGAPFQDNAILQQQMPVPVWGTSLPGADVTVSFAGQSHRTKADTQGRWRITLEPMVAPKLRSVNDTPAGQTMTIVCRHGGERASAQLQNLVVGEVWLAAGQSNMAGRMKTNRTRHHPADTIERADYPAFRQLSAAAGEPWLVCSPTTAPDFKKVVFFFGRRVQRDALVPVGIIHAAVGGSNIEPWLADETEFAGKHYRRFIEPVVGYPVRGAIWYQGESNAKDGRAYGPKLRSLINGWRRVWNQPDSTSADGPRSEFSFYFVQLPGIGTSPTDVPAQGDGRAEIRQAQFETLALANTGMAVTLDVGDVREHPPNKYDTGVRLAHLALHRDYGFEDLLPTGPLYKSHRVVGDSIRVRFDHAEGGLLIARKTGFEPPEPVDAALGWLSIRDVDGKWHWAQGRIDGDELVVTAGRVTQPTAVRYAYTNHPTGALVYNRAGLPAGPFTTCGYDAPGDH